MYIYKFNHILEYNFFNNIHVRKHFTLKFP